MLLGRQDKS